MNTSTKSSKDKSRKELDRLISNTKVIGAIIEGTHRQGGIATKGNIDKVKSNISKTKSDILVPIGTRIQVPRLYDGLLEGEYMVTQLPLEESCVYALVDLSTGNCWNVLTPEQSKRMSMCYVNLTLLLGLDKGIKYIQASKDFYGDSSNYYSLFKGKKFIGTLKLHLKRI